MGTRIIEETFDDIDGTDGPVTKVPFSYEGVHYEIELNEKNVEKIKKAFAPYVERATRVGGRKNSKVTLGPTPREIRDWGRSNGYDVPDRGIIPSEVKEAFAAAN